jgi:hypothetical protein
MSVSNSKPKGSKAPIDPNGPNDIDTNIQGNAAVLKLRINARLAFNLCCQLKPAADSPYDQTFMQTLVQTLVRMLNPQSCSVASLEGIQHESIQGSIQLCEVEIEGNRKPMR